MDNTLFNLEGTQSTKVYDIGKWGYSSAGRAPALQAGGQRFDPVYLHHSILNIEKAPLFPPDRAQRSGSGWKEERQRSEGAFSAGGSGGYGVCLDEGS